MCVCVSLHIHIPIYTLKNSRYLSAINNIIIRSINGISLLGSHLPPQINVRFHCCIPDSAAVAAVAVGFEYSGEVWP